MVMDCRMDRANAPERRPAVTMGTRQAAPLAGEGEWQMTATEVCEENW